MKISACALSLLTLALPVAGWLAPASQAQSVTEIGGQKVITLSRKAFSTTKPEFTSITVVPGRALFLQQVTANFPGKGNVDVLASPSLAETKAVLEAAGDPYGNKLFSIGAAFLYPYPNRIRGKLSADGKTLETAWDGRKLVLPANWGGKNPGAEPHAIHGLILNRGVDEVSVKEIPGGQEVVGIMHCGDFNGQWPSKSDLKISISLTAEAVDVKIVATNVGTTPEPVAFAWHPYFNFPSGDRKQARISVPAGNYAEVNNYDEVFPTGKIIPVAGTKYDFSAPEGKALADTFLDDNFGDLKGKDGVITVKVVDPAAKYGVAIEGLTKNIKGIQVYAPPAKSFVAVEHQTNLNDPLGKQWAGKDNGLITLAPGKSADWHVRLKVFVP